LRESWIYFFEAEISIARSRKSDLHTLTEVVLKNPFAGIRRNYLRTQTAAYFVELIEICHRARSPGTGTCLLLLPGLSVISIQTIRRPARLTFRDRAGADCRRARREKLKADQLFALGNLFGTIARSRVRRS
jgi:hypothetical protein